MNIPPPEYLAEVDKICKQNNILLIVDEVFTGFGRTGKMFAMDHYDIMPDIVTLAKGMAGGYAAISAACTTERIYNAFLSDQEGKAFEDVITMAGTPIACAVALKAIDIIETEGLVERSLTLGKYLKGMIEDNLSEHPLVGSIHGQGLFCIVHVVKDKKTKEPLLDTAYRERFAQKCREHGLNLTMIGQVSSLGTTITFQPPLVITKEDLEWSVPVVKNALDEVHKMM